MAITQKILHMICILVACFKYFTRTTVLCSDARDQRSLSLVLSRANHTHLVLFLFTVLVMASPQIGRVKSRVLFMDARSPCLEGHFRACYWYHAQFTRGSGKCKKSACCFYCRIFWTHCWPYAISFIENCVIFLKKG